MLLHGFSKLFCQQQNAQVSKVEMETSQCLHQSLHCFLLLLKFPTEVDKAFSPLCQQVFNLSIRGYCLALGKDIAFSNKIELNFCHENSITTEAIVMRCFCFCLFIAVDSCMDWCLFFPLIFVYILLFSDSAFIVKCEQIRQCCWVLIERCKGGGSSEFMKKKKRRKKMLDTEAPINMEVGQRSFRSNKNMVSGRLRMSAFWIKGCGNL